MSRVFRFRRFLGFRFVGMCKIESERRFSNDLIFLFFLFFGIFDFFEFFLFMN